MFGRADTAYSVVPVSQLLVEAAVHPEDGSSSGTAASTVSTENVSGAGIVLLDSRGTRSIRPRKNMAG